MHIHILGICGTFMGGVARLALEAGHSVSGSDAHVYPPMSTQLEALGIAIDALDDLSQFDRHIDCVVVGNAMTRGYPAVEVLLNRGLPYTSGPQWLAEHVLQGQHVLAVSGTHGKTTTSSMLAWILFDAGLDPGFLIGGVPANFSQSARAGSGKLFVVEADEYDSAFFDKRSKFVHYRPRTLVMNNLEFDHADIFDDLDDIKRQFHHLVRTIPGDGRVIYNGCSPELESVLDMGCWSQRQSFAVEGAADWSLRDDQLHQGGAVFERWQAPMPGQHNASNALAAVAAAAHVGVSVHDALAALQRFEGVARRLQIRGRARGVTVYDDFAHHPTAVRATLEAVRSAVSEPSPTGRVIAVLEPRSNTMKTAVDLNALAEALAVADEAAVTITPDVTWKASELEARSPAVRTYAGVTDLLEALVPGLRAGDQVVIMSNGGFDGIHQTLLDRLVATPH